MKFYSFFYYRNPVRASAKKSKPALGDEYDAQEEPSTPPNSGLSIDPAANLLQSSQIKAMSLNSEDSDDVTPPKSAGESSEGKKQSNL